MNYKTHVVGGVVAGAVASKINPSLVIPVVIVCAGIGGLVPDLDHRGSYLGRRMRLTSYALSKLGHRGATHSPIMLSIVFGLLYMLLGKHIPLSKEIFLGLYVGSLSHVFLDMFNTMGVPLFSPIYGKYVSFGKIKVGGLGESIVRLGLIFVLILAVVNAT